MIKYEESRADRDHLRDTLRRHGKDSVDQVAQAIRERWHHGHMRSYRLAAELSLPQVCTRVNDLQGAALGDPGYLDPSNLSKFEHWPHGARGRRPSAGYLIALAQVYGTNPRSLIAEVDWETLPSLERLTLQAVDHAPVAPTPARGIMDGARPPAGTAPHDPPNWWAAPEPIGSGNPIERDVLSMTGEESARYVDHGGNIGEMTLDLLRSEITLQSRRFANTDRLALFGTVRLLRDRIFAYLDGGQSMSQRRDLYFLAGAACGLLAAVSDDLGHQGAAMSHARAGHVFATEAGDPALTAWMYAMQANICYWSSQPGKAREYARRGGALQPAGSVGVWLPSIEARACGELGDAEGVRRAVYHAAEAREVLQFHVIDEFGGQMGFNEAKQHHYLAGAFLGIGDDSAVVEQVWATIAAYEQGPAEEYNYGNTAIARFHAAVAQVRAGELDGAGESAQVALNVAPEHRTAQVDKSARRLYSELQEPDVSNAPLAVETRDRIEEFLSLSPARLELS